MPLDVLGCTRVTLMQPPGIRLCLEKYCNLMNLHRDGDRLLQLLIVNEEFLISLSHHLVLNTSLPFVHTARRSYRSSVPMNNSDLCIDWPPNIAKERCVNLNT